tara:strand:- start:438 stop:563 length:126 start_codon:yes stop_codon:yes gene_type:complete
LRESGGLVPVEQGGAGGEKITDFEEYTDFSVRKSGARIPWR